MLNLINELSEIIYVADLNTFEILYLNYAGQKLFHLSEEEYKGKKCYEVLQHQKNPCSFCNNSRLTYDTYYEWEHSNAVTGNHYILKDKLIKWEDREARIEIAFDVTKKEIERKRLENVLKMEQDVMKCLRTLHKTMDMDESLNNVLAVIGGLMQSDRVYILEISGEFVSNTYEWCKEGISREKVNLQHIPVSSFRRWVEEYNKIGYVMIENLESLKDKYFQEYELLNMQGIHSLIAVPLEMDGVLLGFLGTDNFPAAYGQNAIYMLEILALFIASATKRCEQAKILERLSWYDKLTGLLNRNAFIQTISAQNQPLEHKTGILYADLNGLKEMNDKYGHQKGDEMLCRFADLLNQVFQGYPVYRIGGDEFSVICKDIDQMAFDRLVQEFQSRPEIRVNGVAAVGAAWGMGKNRNDLMNEADQNMYRNKRDYYNSRHMGKDRRKRDL